MNLEDFERNPFPLLDGKFKKGKSLNCITEEGIIQEFLREIEKHYVSVNEYFFYGVCLKKCELFYILFEAEEINHKKIGTLQNRLKFIFELCFSDECIKIIKNIIENLPVQIITRILKTIWQQINSNKYF